MQCLDCLALFQDPVLTAAGYAAVMTEADASFRASDDRPDEQVAWILDRGLAGGGRRVLDVGCHDGGLLSRMPGDDERIGVDLDAPALERAIAVHGDGIRFVLSTFEELELDVAIDTFTMFHVLEHLPRPVEALRRLAQLAAPEGRLVVEVPIAEKGETNDVSGFFSVYHTTHFTRDSLRRALLAAGWHVHEWFEPEGYNGCRVVAGTTAPAEAPAVPAADVAAPHRCLAAWHRNAAHAETVLGGIAGAPRCLIWGGGSHTETLYHATSFFQAAPDREYVIVDRDPVKAGGSWRGIPIVPPDELASVDDGTAPLIASSYRGTPSIAAEAEERGIAAGRIVALYDEFRLY